MARMTESTKIQKLIGPSPIIKSGERFNMINVKSFPKFFLRNVACFTPMIRSFTCLLCLRLPIRAFVIFMSAFPSPRTLTNKGLTSPLPKTNAGTKVMRKSLTCISHIRFFVRPAIITLKRCVFTPALCDGPKHITRPFTLAYDAAKVMLSYLARPLRNFLSALTTYTNNNGSWFLLASSLSLTYGGTKMTRRLFELPNCTDKSFITLKAVRFLRRISHCLLTFYHEASGWAWQETVGTTGMIHREEK